MSEHDDPEFDLETSLNRARIEGMRCINIFMSENGDYQVNVNGGDVVKISKRTLPGAALHRALKVWRDGLVRKREVDDIV